MNISNGDQFNPNAIDGQQPKILWGTAAPDGTVDPQKNAKAGSLYARLSTTAPGLYLKVAEANASADWAQMSWGTGAALKVKKIPVTTLTSAEKDTGWDLPAKALVVDVFVNVTTLEATATTKTIDVGLLSSESGGDADGFLNDVSTATPAAIKRGAVTVTSGVWASMTFGVLLADFTAGTNADDRGLYNRKWYASDAVTAKSVSYTLGSTHTELVADIYVIYIEVS